MESYVKNLAAIALYFGLASIGGAQNAPATLAPDQQKPADATAASPVPAALTTPAITGPLQASPPLVFDAGPVGRLDLNGIVSGMGLWQGHPVSGDSPAHGDLSNAQIFLQKTEGWLQFYLQAGVYNIPALGTPFLSSSKALTDFWGPVPVGYLKLQAGKSTSFEIGALPTLMGAESTFTFQNMNIERGLLWNQENAVNRGIQVNQTLGKFTASLSWNDGFYSNRYSWLSGSLTYANGPHSLAFEGMGNLSQTQFQNLTTPVQNNGSMYALVYTYSKGPWMIQPYWQYSSVPRNPTIGIVKGASTNGGAILLSRAIKNGFFLAGRWEYISSTGTAAEQSVNLEYGPGSAATSVTVTPSFQHAGFFVRGEFSFVHATSYTPGYAFGPQGTDANQARAMAEIGFLFGNNLTERKSKP